MLREKCCGAFPEFVCGDCPHANTEQQAQGGVSFKFIGDGPRCMGCFESKDIHLGPELKCPPAQPKTPPPPVPTQRIESASTVQVNPVLARRRPECPSCHKPWNGQRLPRPSPEGVFCGTCNQQAFYE